MKKITLCFVLTLIIGSIFSQNLKLSLDYTSYATENLEPYIEFTFIIDGKSVKYMETAPGQYEAGVEIKIDITNQENNSAVKGMHFVMTSPIYQDTVPDNKAIFGDIVNFSIPNGSYLLDFTLTDVHNPGAPPITYSDDIVVYFPEDKVITSPVLLASKITPATEEDFFAKYGYNFTPLEYSYLDENQFYLFPYFEVYNTEKILGTNAHFIVRGSIESLTNKWLSLSEYEQNTLYETAPALFIPMQFNLYSLPSGNYNVVIEILDTNRNSLVKNLVFFQRYNSRIELDISNYEDIITDSSFVDKIKDINVLREYTSSLFPIADFNEVNFFSKNINKLTIEQLQRFFYAFWVNREPDNPERAWLGYKAKVDYVQRAYGSNLVKGYRTDRGRVYLQYGPPDNIKESVFSPRTYAYQVWQYYSLEGLSNVKFVFCNYDNVSNDYQLVHSDKPGEFYNPAWQRDILRGHEAIQDWSVKRPQNFWGNDMDDNWSDF